MSVIHFKYPVRTMGFIPLVFTAFSTLANEVTQPIDHLFDAMREHNEQKLLNQFTTSALLQRAGKDSNVQTTDIAKFAVAIGKSTSFLDEQLLAKRVQQSGNLASVWTPYVFYLDQKVSHCGINSFQLIHTEQGWKIHYLIDNVFEGDCEEFAQAHAEKD